MNQKQNESTQKVNIERHSHQMCSHFKKILIELKPNRTILYSCVRVWDVILFDFLLLSEVFYVKHQKHQKKRIKKKIPISHKQIKKSMLIFRTICCLIYMLWCIVCLMPYALYTVFVSILPVNGVYRVEYVQLFFSILSNFYFVFISFYNVLAVHLKVNKYWASIFCLSFFTSDINTYLSCFMYLVHTQKKTKWLGKYEMYDCSVTLGIRDSVISFHFNVLMCKSLWIMSYDY